MADGHTSLVRGARILLPVAALGLLSTLFLVPRTVNPDDAIPFAEVDVSMRARDQQLTAPRFVGVSREGSEFALTADRALPDTADPRRMTAETVALDVIDPNDARLTVRARTAQVDTGAREIRLEGDVQIETSTGYRLTAPVLEGRLGVIDIRATGGVEGDGPLGTLKAGEMRLTEDEEGGRHLTFAKGVELLYLPPDP